MARIFMDSELLGKEILELKVPYPNKKWFIHKFLWMIGFTAVVVLMMAFLDRHTIDVILLRDWFCLTVLIVVLTLFMRLSTYGCLNKIVFYQDAFVVYRKPILYRVVKDVFYTKGLEIIDKSRDKKYIEFRNNRGYSQVISYEDGWTDEQLELIAKQLEQYEGVTFVRNKKHFFP